MREKYYSLAKKVRLISQANKAYTDRPISVYSETLAHLSLEHQRRYRSPVRLAEKTVDTDPDLL